MIFWVNLGVHITVLVWGEFEGSFDIDGNGSILYKNDGTSSLLSKWNLYS